MSADIVILAGIAIGLGSLGWVYKTTKAQPPILNNNPDMYVDDLPSDVLNTTQKSGMAPISTHSAASLGFSGKWASYLPEFIANKYATPPVKQTQPDPVAMPKGNKDVRYVVVSPELEHPSYRG